MTNEEILALPMQPNDAEAATIHDYLRALLRALWDEGESFSGKRPFGNSGWEYDIFCALIAGGALLGTLDDHGFCEEVDPIAGRKLIQSVITTL